MYLDYNLSKRLFRTQNSKGRIYAKYESAYRTEYNIYT